MRHRVQHRWWDSGVCEPKVQTEDFLVKCDYLGIARSTLTPLVDSIIAKLVDKLNDGGARIREAVANGIKLLSSSTVVGPNPVAVQLLKALPAKQKGLWRPIFGRIQFLEPVFHQALSN